MPYTPSKPTGAPLARIFRSRPAWSALALLAILGATTGCVEAGARAVQTGAVVADAVQDRISDNLARRKMVRDLCWSMLEERLTKLRAEGQFAAAEELLRERYPSLLTERAIQKVIASVEEGRPADLPPDECGPARLTVPLMPAPLADTLPPQ